MNYTFTHDLSGHSYAPNRTKPGYHSGSKNRLSSHILTGFLLYLLILLPGITSAQTQRPIINSKLSGRLFDSRTKEPLPGASVQIEGTTHQVTTDADGRFEFTTGQKFPYTLIINYIGYDRLEINATSENIDIPLVSQTRELGEVLVVAYGTQEKKDLIGSVAKVKLDDVKAIPGGSFESQLQGKVAGLQINTNTGVPGETINVRLRGATSMNGNNNPLYIIDGVFIENGSLQTYSTGKGNIADSRYQPQRYRKYFCIEGC